jgi:hypothetical protein
MGLVDDKVWKSNGSIKTNGILPANEGIQIDSESYYNTPIPTAISWNYANTLPRIEFNKHGFYEDGSNVVINATMSDKMRENVRRYQENATSYMLPCAADKFSGLIQNASGSKELTGPFTNNNILANDVVSYGNNGKTRTFMV